MAANVPFPSKASLVQQYVGKSLKDIPLPAAVLDIASVKRNCKRMLDAVGELGWELRVGVASHKTTEITRLQIGEDPEDVRIIVSTLSEAENLLPLLLEYQHKGLQVSVFYNVPVPPSQVERIANISRVLGKRAGNIRLLVDHEAQIPLLLQISELSGYPPYVYIAIDRGSRRSGVQPGSLELESIFRQIEQIVLGGGRITIAYVGFYCEADPSLLFDTKVKALASFEADLSTLFQSSPVEEIRLSVPESPILMCLPQLMEYPPVLNVALATRIGSFKQMMTTVNERNHHIETHASDYALLDFKQLVIYQRFLNDDHPLDDYPSRYVPAAEDMPLTILTEVTSLYPGRGTNGKTEALVAVGTSVLGPKPHHLPDSVGWGTVDPRPPFQWHQGWAVQRADRESAVLTYENENQANLLQCGQRVKIKPGDAASASAHFGWYFVVDSSRLDRGDEIVDIFVRWKD